MHQLQLSFRAAPNELAQQPVQPVAEALAGTEPHDLRVVLAECRDGRGRGVGRGEHGTSMRQEGRAGLGECDTAGRPVEQGDTQLALEPPHLLAHRGLDDVQPFGRAAEVQLLGDGQEVPQLTQFHGSPFISVRDQCTCGSLIG